MIVLQEVPSSPSPNELHTTGEDPFRGTEECYEEGHIQEYTRAEYNGVSWPHHQLPDYNNHVDMNNVDMNNANWPPQHQNYMTAADGEYGSVEEGGHHFNQHYGHVHPEQFVQEDLVCLSHIYPFCPSSSSSYLQLIVLVGVLL